MVTGRVTFLGGEGREDHELLHSVTRAMNFAFADRGSQYNARFLAPGDELIREGAAADYVYIVKKGRLRAYKGRGPEAVTLGYVEAGEFVGEMAYINGEPRTANVEALTGCELIELSVSTLDRVLYRRSSWSRMLMVTLTRRLKQANAIIEERAGRGEG